MARIDVRYFTARAGRAGAAQRYFWQPSKKLRARGWALRRIPENWADIADPAALEAAAISAAQGLNAELDAWRSGIADPATGASGIADTARAMTPPLRNVNALIELYRKSARFARLRPSSQRVYKQALAAIAAWAGDAPVKAMTAPRFQRFYEALFARTPGKANGVMRVALQLFEHGRREGWVAVNPAAKPGLIALEPSGKIWPREAVVEFVAVADALGFHGVGTAVLIDEWLGQRQADVLKLPRNLLAPTGQVIRQGKTDAVIKLPIAAVPHLVARIEAELARQAEAGIASTRLIVNDETKQPYNTDTFRHHFAIVRAELAKRTPSFTTDYVVPGVDPGADNAFTLLTTDLWFMHLRHTAITRLAEARCSVPEISAISGHTKKSVEQMLERYLIRTGRLARQAFARRLEAEAAPADEGREQG